MSERRAALIEAAEEVRTEARWQELERQRSGLPRHMPTLSRTYLIERLLMLETILRDRAAASPTEPPTPPKEAVDE
jgi:hypothetical protein